MSVVTRLPPAPQDETFNSHPEMHDAVLPRQLHHEVNMCVMKYIHDQQPCRTPAVGCRRCGLTD